MPRTLDADVEARIREALADPNASYANIAEKIGVSVETIRRRAIRWGLERDTHVRMTDEQHEKIRRMLRAGCWTYWQIAQGAGCARSAVQEIATALGIDRTDRKPVQFRQQEK
jgi:uncharacterized protein YerC